MLKKTYPPAPGFVTLRCGWKWARYYTSTDLWYGSVIVLDHNPQVAELQRGSSERILATPQYFDIFVTREDCRRDPLCLQSDPPVRVVEFVDRTRLTQSSRRVEDGNCGVLIR